MRRLFFILLIALLPLRGWTGDMMAISMAAGKASATNSVATDEGAMRTTSHFDQKMAAEMPDDCPMLAQMAEKSVASTPGTPNAPCSSCDTCELCLAMLTAAAPVPLPVSFVPHAVAWAAAKGFASADLAVSFKPPIS